MFYTLIRLVLVVILKVLFRYKITGRENIPRTGAAIIAANHKSYLDPILLAIASGTRQLNFMAKSELLKIPVFGGVLRALNTFPVKRGLADRSAIATSLRLLSSGELLIIFPEGTRHREPGLGNAYPGATSIALKMGVPIIPVGITGAEKVMPDGSKIPRLPKLRVRIGEAIPVEKTAAGDRKEKEAEITVKMMQEIGRLIAGD